VFNDVIVNISINIFEKLLDLFAFSFEYVSLQLNSDGSNSFTDVAKLFDELNLSRYE